MPAITSERLDPEKILRQVQAEEREQLHGRLKVFLGYSSGVGKSFRMLDEGRRRKERGQDVVVGAIQPFASPEAEAVLKTLEVIPLRSAHGMQAIDVSAVLKRRPQVCLIDGLAYDNPPASTNKKRWQDVEQILQAGISVIGTVNLQYIEEWRDRVEKITGKRVPYTIPQSFLNTADEIAVVDTPAEKCLQRDGEATGEVAEIRQRKLSELREMALVLAADVVDSQLENYLYRQGVEQLWGTQERILVYLTSKVDTHIMLESGKRNADRFHGEFYAAYVTEPELSPKDRAVIDKNIRYARSLGARVEVLDSQEPIAALLQFARERGITQIFVSHSKERKWWSTGFANHVDRLIRLADDIDVRLFP